MDLAKAMNNHKEQNQINCKETDELMNDENDKLILNEAIKIDASTNIQNTLNKKIPGGCYFHQCNVTINMHR